MSEVKKGLQPHEIRVVEERVELMDKITKLHKFMCTDFYQTLDGLSQLQFDQQVEAMKTYADVLLRRINRFEGKLEDTVIESTRGQELVGYNFNPSNLSQVDKAKKHCADLIDMVLDDHDIKVAKATAENPITYNRNILKTLAVTTMVQAQMAVIKILTWSK
jgi:hypothetical protein